MNLIINKVALFGVPNTILMSHREFTIEWEISLFDKNDKVVWDIFHEINGYWAHLPMTVQDEIFQTYTDIRNLFDTFQDSQTLTRQLMALVAKLYSYHDLTEINHWFKFYSNIILPPNLMLHNEYVGGRNMQGTRERTYLKADYEWLMVLSISLRVMIPIWGEYITTVKKETGTTYKEYYGYKLLANTNIIKSEPMERLRIYVEKSIATDKTQHAAVLDSISTEDFPIWILAKVLIRKLSISDVSGINPSTFLVTDIYKYVSNIVNGHESSFMGKVREKILDGQTQDSENNLSKLESYKPKEELAQDNVQMILFYNERIRTIIEELCPGIDLKLYDTALEAVATLSSEILWEPQIQLIQWIIDEKTPARGVYLPVKTETLDLLAGAIAILWHKGHYDLAALICAKSRNDPEYIDLDASEARSRITKENLEILDKLYPYHRRTSSRQKNAKRVNPAVEAIESMAAKFSEHKWVLTLPTAWINDKLQSGNFNNKKYDIPTDIKNKIANLVIELFNKP